MATASDNFNRANESPLAGNWTGYGGGVSNNRFTLTSNAAAAANTTTDDCSAYWNANTFSNDQFSQADVTVSGTGGGGQGIGVILRTDGAPNVGGVGKYTQYRIVADHAASSNVEVAKFITGSYTMLTRYTKSFTNGATLSAQVSGTTITTVFGGATLGSVTDSSVTSGHPAIGFSSNETSASLDNWSGGDLAAAASLVWAGTRDQHHIPHLIGR